MRGGAPTRRYMKHNDRTGGYPTDIIFVDTETNPAPDDMTRQVLDFGFAEYWRGGTLRDELAFDTSAEFWSWCESKALSKRKLWVYAHNMGGFDFMVLDGEGSFRERGWEVTATIVPRPFLYRVRKDGRTISVCDSLNIYSQPGMSSLADLGKIHGIPKGVDPGGDAPRAERLDYCRNDVRILRKAMFAWWEFCRELDFGYHAFTTAGQALNAFRHRFMPEQPIIDHRPRAAALERKAYCGGRTDALWVGPFPEHVDSYDVNSMYPYVMRDRLYPVELLTIQRAWNSGGVSAIKAQLDMGVGCIATVRVRTEVPLYPVKGERLIFPIGEFVTTLCTESLKLGIERGDVVSVEGDVAYYRMAPLFRGWVEELYALRMRYRADGNDVYDRLCKLLMNSLYGKFGQMTPAWEPMKDDDLEAHAMVDTMRSLGLTTMRGLAASGRIVNIREIGGSLEVEGLRHEAFNAMCSVAAHVTDYARCWLWEYMETAGRDHVLYVDTDSLYVDQIGSSRLAPLVSDELGAIKREKTSPEGMTVYGVKDYVIGDVVKRKGVRARAVEVDPESDLFSPVPKPGSGVFQQDRFRGFLGAMRAGELDTMIVGPIRKRLKRTYLKGTPPPGGVGRTSPFIMEVC